MKTNEHNETDLQKEAPVLFGMERRNLFQAPDGYFDTLTSKIQDKIQAESKITVWQKIMEQLFLPRLLMPVAASIIVVVYIIKYSNPTTVVVPEVEISYSDLSQSAYLSQIDEHIISEEYLLAMSGRDENESVNYLIENNITDEALTEALNSN